MKIKKPLLIMAALYMIAGLNHFFSTETYLKIMPPYIPLHLFMVYASGVAEVGLGVLILIPRFRKLATYGIILLLLAVFPANIYMLTSQGKGTFIADWPYWLRLMLQGVLIYWAWIYTKIDHPSQLTLRYTFR